MKRWLELSFGADLRSLAAMRVGLALVLLVDLANRLIHVKIHYSDGGVFSRADAAQIASPYALCLHNASGYWLFAALLIVAHMVFAFWLLVGYRTRLASLLCWVLLVSLHHRNPTVLLGADPWLRSLLFWGMFLPWGKRWAIDAPQEPKNQNVLSAATVGLVVQISVVYLFAGWLKSGESWWPNGTAVADTLRILEFRAGIPGISDYLLHFPDFLKSLTYAILALEQIGIFFLFAPFFTVPLRAFVAGSLMVFHVALASAMNLHIFPWVGVACLISLFPGVCWEYRPLSWLSRRLDRLTRRRPAWRKSCPEVNLGRPTTWFLGALSLLVVMWNFQMAWVNFKFPQEASQIMVAGGFKQNWALFAPDAPKSSNLILPVGIRPDGERILLTPDGERLSGEFELEGAFDYLRWRQYHLYVINNTSSGVRATYSQYLLRRWNLEHPQEPISQVELLSVSRPYLEGNADEPLRMDPIYLHPPK